MIKVYDSNERLFNHNGIKILHPLGADITKKDNGDYYVELEDTIENIDFYQNGLIVRIPTPWGVQGFRMTNPKVKNKKISVNGIHIFDYTFPEGESEVVIDSEKEDAYLGDVLKNRNMNGEFPVLLAGTNKIEWSGDIESIQILPRSRWL